MVISDGFGDADLDNNGVVEAFDVDIDLDDELGNSFEPPVFEGTSVEEITAAQNPADVGIPWFFSRGFTSGGTGDPKANIKIGSDATGRTPETNPAEMNLPAINAGNALFWESKGRGSSATGFFGQRIALGPEVGDQVKASFDFRVWLSAPNANSVEFPEAGELRWGLFQDTDEQIGLENSMAGRFVDTNGDGFVDPQPAVWGLEGGHFRGDVGEAGAMGDHGWYTRIEIEDTANPIFTLPDGANARIREETNESEFGDTGLLRFLEGSDDDFVARPDAENPDFVTLDRERVYNLELVLTRTEESIHAAYNVEDVASGEKWTLEGEEGLEDNNNRPGSAGIESDSWDYVALRNTGFDDFDFVIDNFVVEVIGSNEPSSFRADFDGDGVVDDHDYDHWLEGFPTTAGASKDEGDADDDGDVDGLDFLAWQQEFPSGGGIGASLVPEPLSSGTLGTFLVLLMLPRNTNRRS